MGGAPPPRKGYILHAGADRPLYIVTIWETANGGGGTADIEEVDLGRDEKFEASS